MTRNTTRPRSTPSPTRDATPPPRTLGQLRALLQAALDVLTSGRPLRRRDRADLVALLRAALRYRAPAEPGAPR